MKQLKLTTLAFIMCFCFSQNSHAEFGTTTHEDIQGVVDNSRTTLLRMMADKDYKHILPLLKKSQAIVILPSYTKGGILLGVGGGNGLIMVRNKSGWSYPCFISLSSVSIGMQFGVETSEVILLIMTAKGLNSVMRNKFTFGVDTSITAGGVGAGVGAQLTTDFKNDINIFSKSTGFFAGSSLSGATLTTLHKWNSAYYKCVSPSPKSILLQGECSNEKAKALISALATVESHSGKTNQIEDVSDSSSEFNFGDDADTDTDIKTIPLTSSSSTKPQSTSDITKEDLD